MPRTPKPKPDMTADEAIREVQRLGPLLAQLRNRVLQTERMCRQLGQAYCEDHIPKPRLDLFARRRNAIDNSLREIRCHLKKHGNEFDREPYLENPE